MSGQSCPEAWTSRTSWLFLGPRVSGAEPVTFWTTFRCCGLWPSHPSRRSQSAHLRAQLPQVMPLEAQGLAGERLFVRPGTDVHGGLRASGRGTRLPSHQIPELPAARDF